MRQKGRKRVKGDPFSGHESVQALESLWLRLGEEVGLREIKEILREVPLFSKFTEQDLDALATIVRRRSYPKNFMLFQQGDPGEEFLILSQGSVKVELTNPDGKELTLVILKPYQFLGELALLDDVPRSATVVTMEKAEFLVISKRDFGDMLNAYPRMCLPILKQLTRRIRVLTDDIASMAFLDSYSRVARKILSLAEEMGIPNTDGSIMIDQALTHQQLANLVGTTRETVTKILNEMKDKNLISIKRHRITVIDPAELAERANLSGYM